MGWDCCWRSRLLRQPHGFRLAAPPHAGTEEAERIDRVLAFVQQELFDVGSELATPPESEYEGMIRGGRIASHAEVVGKGLRNRVAERSSGEPPIAVSESGLKTTADLARLKALGYRAFLIGERFMTAADPGAALASLLDGGINTDTKDTKAKP